MSDSSGAVAATFTSPTSPTSGLQPYALEKPALNLYPGPDTRQSRLKRLIELHRKRGKPNAANHSRHMRKGLPPMHDDIEAMVATLRQSVTGIVDAAPENRDDLLTKSFGEFQEMLLATADEALAKAAPEGEEPLYKGLGCVGRIANMVGRMAEWASNIKTGKDYSGDQEEDPCSPEVGEMLDHMVAVGELALRAAVNEHVDFPEDGEEPEDGMHYIAVPMLSGGEAVVKTALPEDLAKLATDPDQIIAAMVESGAEMLLQAGVPQAALEKALEPEGLAKAFPPPKKKGAPPPKDTGSDDSDGGSDDGSDADSGSDDGSDGEGMDPTQADMNPYPGGGGAGDSPLDVAGQLCAALMIQINHIQDLVEGRSGPGPDAGADPGPAADPVAPQPQMGKRAPAAPDQAAIDRMVEDRVAAQLAPLVPVLEKFMAQPAPHAAMIGPAPVMTPELLKRVETGGELPASSGFGGFTPINAPTPALSPFGPTMDDLQKSAAGTQAFISQAREVFTRSRTGR